jgi:hypothetical protein
VAFTVQVPSDAAPGDHLAGLAFENAHPSTAGGNFAVTTVTRSVIGILVHVPGQASFHLHLDGAQIQDLAGGSGPSVVVTLGDDGGALGKPRISVTLDGPAGYHRTQDRLLDTILPGDTIPFPLLWPETLARGDYRVSVTGSEPGMAAPVVLSTSVRLASQVLGAQATASASGVVAASPPSPSGGFPAWLIAPLLGTTLVGGVVGAILARRLGRPR